MELNRTAGRIAFLSTLSLRRATIDRNIANSKREFLSTLSLRRATGRLYIVHRGGFISIHALLAESDLPTGGLFFFIGRFLSTLSLRRATYLGARKSCDVCDFYPRSPCGERPALSQSSAKSTPISIHALLAESDHSFSHAIIILVLFLSTLSLRRATNPKVKLSLTIMISIHALLAESDLPSVARNSKA